MIIGLDVGGTHTDVVLLGDEGLASQIKVPTDPSELYHSVLTGLDRITAGTEYAAIQRIVLSTTLTTNAIVQDKLPPVAMIVSAGPGIDPQHYRMGAHYYPVAGAVDHRGRETAPLDPAEIRDIAARIKHEAIRTVGVVGKFSVRNPVHELQICEILKDSCDKVFLGHRISGNLDFPRRIATTYLNAAAYPIQKRFYEAVQKSLAIKGLSQPIRILKADGGNMRFDASIEFPGLTILSGPAASVMGAVAFCFEEHDALVMDIGGTTTDMAVLINRAPVLDPVGIEIGPYKTLIRSLDTLSIGIGGDSAVRITGGALQVGPDRDGPALAYGGPTPTPTDAFIVLENLQTGNREKSVEGIKSLAAALGVSVETVASQIMDKACRSILTAAQKLVDRINHKPVYTIHELKEGYQVRPKSILVLGGPAPDFARHLQKLTTMQVRVIPKWEVANAIGAALARTTCEVTLLADTERQVAVAPEENYSQEIDDHLNLETATQIALDLLRQKAIARGANPDYLETEVVEGLQFNMVRGFRKTGKNIRVKVQVKPGMIHGYDHVIAKLAEMGRSAAGGSTSVTPRA
jgi:N-methylhydantoinase A/oxoprolinase/acetone carboxylase beta subunit